jgi:hypothetical protein
MNYAESSEILQNSLKTKGSPVALGFVDELSSDFFCYRMKGKIH